MVAERLVCRYGLGLCVEGKRSKRSDPVVTLWLSGSSPLRVVIIVDLSFLSLILSV